MTGILLLGGFLASFAGFLGLVHCNRRLRLDNAALQRQLDFARMINRMEANRNADLQRQNKLQAIRLDSRNS